MGNGSRLTIKDVEEAAAKCAAAFGQSNHMIIPASAAMKFGWGIFNPEYSGTPWADMLRMSKRQRIIAGLHTSLKKLGVFKNISEEEFMDIRHKSIKRLKRAKWARYGKKA